MAPTLRPAKRLSSPSLVPLIGDLPYRERVSPSKRPKTPKRELVGHVRFLFFQKYESLEQIVRQTERLQTQNTRWSQHRFDYLSREVQNLYAAATPQRNPHNDHVPASVTLHAPPNTAMPPPTRQLVSTRSAVSLNKSFNTSFASTNLQSTNVSFNTEQAVEATTPATTPDSTPADIKQFDDSSDLLPSSSSFDLAEAERLERHDEGIDIPPSSGIVEVEPSGPTLHWRISEVPKLGIAPIDLPDVFSVLPFVERVEAYRVMKACALSPDELVARIPQPPSLECVYALLADAAFKHTAFRKCSRDIDNTKLSLHATLRYVEDRSKPLFDLCLELPVKEDLTPFQRKYGAHRFLTIDLPSLNRPPASCGRQVEQLHGKVLEMLAQRQCFLGRKWIHFHTQTKKHQIMLFAEHGVDLSPVSIAEVFEWFIPFELNATQPACKANARLDLGQSRSKSTVIFKPENIIYGHPDKTSTSHVPNFPFDTALDPARRFPSDEVMDDGCSKISAAAMSQISQILGLSYVPAVVQGRIFGAKGVWYCDTRDDQSEVVTITINESQIKVWHPYQSPTDDHVRTMHVVNFSRPARSSYLYPDFLPILVNQGVPHMSILEIARRQVYFATKEYLDALSDSRLLHLWIHAQKDLIGPRLRDERIWYIGSFPDCREERICMLLEAGFECADCKKLAEEARFVGAQAFELEARRFKIQLDQSTSLIGIADPSDTLGPGEIHVGFSSPFRYSQASSEGASALSGLSNRFVLVARNPSMRNSDIQKVRAVYRPELAHLHDVVIFSTKGARPIASMLSGGDYDGDTFWICWDDKLVDPFRNAFAPWERDRQPLEYFRISKDTTRLKDLVPTGKGWHQVAHRLIQRSTAERLKFQMLGPVTLTYGDLTYADGNITSDKAFKLVDLHDLLVDADKQGYRYTEDDWRAFKRDLDVPVNLKNPAYRRFTRPKEARDIAPELNMPKIDKNKYKQDHIIDRLYFEVVKPTIDEAMASAKLVGTGRSDRDPDLVRFYEEFLVLYGDEVQQEIDSLKEALIEIRKMWYDGMGRYQQTRLAADWNLTIDKCKAAYDAISPSHAPESLRKAWTLARGSDSTMWDELKASTMANFHAKQANMIFHIAGEVLCRLKARAHPETRPRTRTIRENMYLSLKPHRQRGFLNADCEDEDSDTGEDEFGASQSTLDALNDLAREEKFL